jgi:O-antigen/teichoic acid export membrane protein
MYDRLKTIFLARRRVATVMTYGAINVMPRVTAAILALIYARVFTLSEYGMYGILSALVVILGAFADLGVPVAIIRNYYDRHDDPEAAVKYLSSVVGGSRLLALLMLPLIGIVLFFLWDLAGIGRAQIWYFVPLLLAVSYFERSTEVLAAICRAVERPDLFSAGNMAQSITTIAAGVLLVVVLHGGVVGALLAVLIGRVASSWVYHLVLKRGISLVPARTDWRELRACLNFGLPILPIRIAAWLRQSALRPILANFVSMSTVGLFSLASSVAAIPLLATVAVDLALTPVYYKRRVSGTPVFSLKMKEFSKIMMAVLFPGWVFSVVFCSNIVHALATLRFAQAVPVCATLFVGAFARSQHPFLTRQIQFLRNTWVMPWISGVCTAIFIALTLVFAPSHGIIAAGWAVALADMAILVGFAWIVRRREQVGYSLLMAIGLWLLLALLAAWVGYGEPVPTVVPKLVFKIAIFCVSVLISFELWVWPSRHFIGELMRG